MTLTNDDLGKIKGLLDAQLEQFMARFDQLEERVMRLERRVTSVEESLSRLTILVEYLREDIDAFAQTATENNQQIKHLDRRVIRLEKQVGLR